MALRQRLSLLTTAAITAAALLAALPGTAYAAGTIVPGSVGPDVSWPQCGSAIPADVPYRFGVVGATGGTPFTDNPCFASEFSWALTTWNPEVYINLDYGQRVDGPLQCAATDAGCQAYNYGSDAAAEAMSHASIESNGVTNSLSVWWLDVETGNNWSDSTDLNSYVIQGALDYIQRHQGRTGGVYSTAYQWSLIAGSYAPVDTPNWVAGSSVLNDWGQCSAPLWPGGQVWAVQYLNYDLNLDQNMGC